jgi:hypothetical protein
MIRRARVTGAWRRLFPASHLSPGVEALIGTLAATPYVWEVRPDGKLRANDGSAELCVVTAVVRYRTARAYGVGDWVRAAASIGLSYAEAGLIVEAADTRSPSARARVVRRRLLGAARTTSPARWTLPADPSSRRRPPDTGSADPRRALEPASR